MGHPQDRSQIMGHGFKTSGFDPALGLLVIRGKTDLRVEGSKDGEFGRTRQYVRFQPTVSTDACNLLQIDLPYVFPGSTTSEYRTGPSIDSWY
jgi:hypothetical protein